MYGDDDLYRIKDIINSVDSKQWTSKQWLVDTLKHLNVKANSIFIAGGWYGLLAHLLRQQYQQSKIISADMDKKTRAFGHMLFSGSNIDFAVSDITKNLYGFTQYDIVMSTSCEHIDREDLCSFITQKNEDGIIVLQSNDYFDLPSHINCSESLEDFVSYVKPHLHQQEIMFQGSLNLGDFNRFMVIGK